MKTTIPFANKGGSGYTIATMALASDLLAQDQRVAMMDCTNLAGGSTDGRFGFTLQNWMAQMAACKRHPFQLDLIACRTCHAVEDSVATCDARGIDVQLIDTMTRLEDLQHLALGLADLSLAPTIGPFEAKYIVAGISDDLECPAHLLGLITGCRNGAQEAAETRMALCFHPVFQSELPWVETISDQILNGDIGHFTASLACQPDQPGFARYSDALKTWMAVQRLTFEVRWALDG